MKNIFILCLCIASVFSCKSKNGNPQDPIEIAYVISGGSKSVEVIDLTNQQLIESFEVTTDAARFPHHIYLSPNKEQLVIGNPAYDFSTGHNGLHGKQFPGGVIVLNKETGIKHQEFEVPFANHNATFSPNGTEIWTTGLSHSGRAYVYDATSSELKNEIILPADPSEIFFTNDGKYAVVRCGESRFLQVIDADSKEVFKEVKIDLSSGNVWQGFGDIVLVSNSFAKSVNFVDMKSFSVIDFVDFSFSPGFLNYNELTEELWVCNSKNNKVNIFKHLDTGWEEITVLEFPNADPHMVKFYSDNKRAMLINQKANNAVFIDTESKAILSSISVGEKPNGIVME